MKLRPVSDPANSIANRFPESMRRFGLAEVYGRCETGECARRARATCPGCGGEYCLAHAGHPDH